MTRILIADDHAVVRSGVRHLLADHPGWSVVAEATNGKDAIAEAIATQPDVAVLDYRLPLLNGIETTQQIRQRVPSVEVLIFTMHDNEDLLRQSFNAGARGYVLKSSAPEQLISAIQSLATHRPFFTDTASQVLLETFVTGKSRVERALPAASRPSCKWSPRGTATNRSRRYSISPPRLPRRIAPTSCASSTSPPRRHWCATPFATIWFRPELSSSAWQLVSMVQAAPLHTACSTCFHDADVCGTRSDFGRGKRLEWKIGHPYC